MATRNLTYFEPKRVKTKAGERQNIYELASIGLSKRSIATRLGYTAADFQKLMDYKEADIQPFQLAYEAGVAEFEEFNARIIDEALHDPEASVGIKVKVARDNLKAKSEEWAPQTRAVKVQLEAGPAELVFESFTQEELDKIAEESAAHDQRTDAEENDTED